MPATLMTKSEAVAKFKKADELFRAGWFDDSFLLLDELDRAFPQKRQLMLPRARCLAELGRFDESIEVCDAMIELWDHDRAARLKRRVLEFVQANGGNVETAKAERSKLPANIPSFSDEDDMPPALSEFHEPTRASIRSFDELAEEDLLLDGVFADASGPRPKRQRSTPVRKARATRTDYGDLVRRIAPIAGWALGFVAVVGIIVWLMSGLGGQAAQTPGEMGETGQVLDRVITSMGAPGWIVVTTLNWLLTTLVIYSVLLSFKHLPFSSAVDSVLDIAIVSFIASIVLMIPLVGIIVTPIMIKHKYEMSWPEFAAYVGAQAGALVCLGAFAWFIWGR